MSASIRSAPSHAARLERASSAPGRVSPRAQHLERLRLAIETRLDAADEAIAGEDRQDVVAVLALRGRDVHLEPVVEIEERLCPVAIVDEAIERREERHAIGNLGATHIGVSLPAGLRQPHAERPEALLGEHAVGLAHGHRLGRRIPAFGEIPQPLLSLSTGHRDDAVRVEDLEHQRDLAAAPPAMRLVRSRSGLVLELARRHRSVAVELAQDIALEARVLDEELGAPTLVRVAPTAPAPPHPRLDERQRLDRPDVRVPLEELLLDPQQAVELRDVVRAESAPEHELLRRRDGGDRVDLEEAEPLHGVEDGRRRAVEELRADGDPAGLVRRHEPHDVSGSCSRRQRTSAESSDSGAASLRAERASSQFA